MDWKRIVLAIASATPVLAVLVVLADPPKLIPAPRFVKDVLEARKPLTELLREYLGGGK